MSDKTSHLRSVLAYQSKGFQDEDEMGLPDRDKDHYQAHSRAMAKPVFALHVIFPNGTVKSFQYQHLDSSTQYLHECIELRFLGGRITHLRLRGRNLWKLYDYLHQHRVSWVQVADRDLAPDGEPIITGVAIEEAKIPDFQPFFHETAE